MNRPQASTQKPRMASRDFTRSSYAQSTPVVNSSSILSQHLPLLLQHPALLCCMAPAGTCLTSPIETLSILFLCILRIPRKVSLGLSWKFLESKGGTESGKYQRYTKNDHMPPFTQTGQPALLTIPWLICTKSAIIMASILNLVRQLLKIAEEVCQSHFYHSI